MPADPAPTPLPSRPKARGAPAAPLGPRTVPTDDGLTLRLRQWPGPAAARGTVLVVHGLGEHIGRYAHVAARLNAAGWHVVGHDQRGHGLSDGPRGQLAAPDDLLRDLARIIDAVGASRPGPLVLLGHSMGGLVAARFVAEGARAPGVQAPAAATAGDAAPSLGSAVHSPAPAPARRTTLAAWHRPLDALVLSSPALATAMTTRQKLLLAVAAPLAPDHAVNNGLQPEWISRDPAVVAAYVADPLVHDRIAPRLVRFIVDGAACVHARAPHWSTPTLLLYAGSDRCVPPAGSAAFAAAAPEDVVAAQEFPALAHEIFNEPEQRAVLDALVQWLDVRFAVPRKETSRPAAGAT